MEFPLLKRPPGPEIPTVASDLEGTLSSGSTVKAMHHYLEKIGKADVSQFIYRKRILGIMFRSILGRNTREAKNDWMRDLIEQFAGFSQKGLRSMTEYVVEQSTWPNRRKKVVAELNAHLDAGRRVVIVSGMSYPILESLLECLPGMEAIGTLVIGEREPFSGLLSEFNVGSRKVEALKSFCDETGKIHAAYGDTYSDLAMLEMSHRPTVVFPDRGLKKAAKNKSWRILDQ